MTQEDKELLLKDICARLPYRVVCKCYHTEFNEWDGKPFVAEYDDILENIDAIGNCLVGGFSYDIEEFKPYLRPMSSMTEEEKREFQSFFPGCFGDQWLDIEEGIIEIFECSSTMTLYLYDFERMIDWLNKHHFDYRGLIEKGLAIEVTKENNPYKD